MAKDLRGVFLKTIQVMERWQEQKHDAMATNFPEQLQRSEACKWIDSNPAIAEVRLLHKCA